MVYEAYNSIGLPVVLIEIFSVSAAITYL